MKTYKFPHNKHNFEFSYIYESYIEEHNHDYFEFSIVTKGSMIHHINDKERIVKENTLLLLRPSDTHYITVENENESFELFNLNVSYDFFESFFELTNKELLDKIKSYDVIEINIPNTSTKYFSNFINKTSTIYQNNNYPEEILMPIFLDLMSVVFHYYQNPIQTQNYSMLVNHMMEVLSNKNNFNLTIEEIAEKERYSYAHINRLFKKETGMTIAKYYTQLRLEYAKRMIETTNDSIYDISVEVGFSSLSHFTKLFNETYGNTPAKHRKMWNAIN